MPFEAFNSSERTAAMENIRRLAALEQVDYDSSSTIIGASLKFQDTPFPSPTSRLMKRRYMRELSSMIDSLTSTPTTMSPITPNNNTATSFTSSEFDTVTVTATPKKKKKKRKKKKAATTPDPDLEAGKEQEDDTAGYIEDLEDDDEVATPDLSRKSTHSSTLDVDLDHTGLARDLSWIQIRVPEITEEPQPMDTDSGWQSATGLSRDSLGVGSFEKMPSMPTTPMRSPSPLASPRRSPARLEIFADITEKVSLADKESVGWGGFCDVYIGHHVEKGKVAMKRPRFTHSEENVLRRFRKEAELWCTFDHRYILPFYGMAQMGRHVYMVSPWVERGNLLDLINREPNIDRIPLLCEIAEALTYLHDKGVVHGDIKGQNVLVSNDGHALLCDFGLTKVLDSMVTSTEVRGAGSMRWMAPELFMDAPKTIASDVYAYGMTIVEVLSGLPPFSHIRQNQAVMLEVMVMKQRPRREPTHCPRGSSYEGLWKIVKTCWVNDAKARPSMRVIYRKLMGLR